MYVSLNDDDFESFKNVYRLFDENLFSNDSPMNEPVVKNFRSPH